MPENSSGARVLHIFGVLDPGGAEKRTLDLLPGLSAQGHQLDFLTLTGRRGQLAAQFETAGSKVFPLRLGAGFPPRFLRLLKERSYDVVHSHVATSSGPILALARAAGVHGRIAHFRSDGDAHGNAWPRRVQRRAGKALISRHATDILGVSPGALTHGYRPDWATDSRCRVIPNGLPPAPTVKTPRPVGTDLRVVNVGRPLPTKRREMVVSIGAHLAAEGTPTTVTFIGQGGGDIAPWVGSVDIPGLRVTLEGVVDDVRTHLPDHDVLVFPSTLEGLPGVVLEALSMGLPVVASDIPGTRYISGTVPGVTLLRADSPVARWASAARDAALAGPSTRQGLREAFAQSCFTTNTTIQQLGEIYAGHHR